eukprot:m.142596 g.142596  ORF g.142596 m.142596 type:complete len:286 (+) comp16164_c0_seq2:1118-1975(+)
MTRGGAELRPCMDQLPDKIVLNLNDTHPALAVPELMRLLLDHEDLSWDEAWDLTHRCCAYTNHTLLPEALERWDVQLLQHVLPRHLEIIFEINKRFLDGPVQDKWPGDGEMRRHLSIIEEKPHKTVNMAKLAVVACFAVNGVAAIHSHLLQTQTFPHFHQLYPTKFRNKTNGVTPRRWLLQANPELAKLITELIGPEWPRDLDRLSKLREFEDNKKVLRQLKSVQHNMKKRFAAWVCHSIASQTAHDCYCIGGLTKAGRDLTVTVLVLIVGGAEVLDFSRYSKHV